MGSVSRETLRSLCRSAAAEGCVLLRNEGGTLPLAPGESVAVFGRCQFQTYASGTGSGGLVNAPYCVNLLQGLNSAGIHTDSETVRAYESWLSAHPYDDGGHVWAAEPWHQEEMPVGDLPRRAAGRCAKALVVLGRTAGEDKDHAPEKGSWLLTDTERDMLEHVSAAFSQVAVALNTSGLMDLSWLDTLPAREHISAVMLCWQGGQETGNGMADTLSGRVNPCGKLPDTVPLTLEDDAGLRNFGGDYRNFYEEDIYVGYRYLETFAPERVRYPFGYGLSYTHFLTESLEAKFGTEGLRMRVRVTNTGDTSGKEVAQLYLEAPQGLLGKPVRVLVDYYKTRLLAPGEAEERVFTVSREAMASYDDSGVTGHPYAYVLEAGEYRFALGNDVRSAKEILVDSCESVQIQELQVVRQCEQALAPTLGFDRIHPWLENGRFHPKPERVPVSLVNLQRRIEKRLPRELPFTGDQGWHLADVAAGRCSMDAFVAQLSPEELCTLVRGEGSASPKVTPGTGGAFGGVSDRLLAHGIPLACGTDGPSGLRLDSGETATQTPIGTSLAATWNDALVEALYAGIGEECRQNEVDLFFGPGMNLHRCLLNGRNFEYFSEDPLLTGRMGAAVCAGLEKSGAVGTIKHLACNNQEKHRAYLDAVVSERALRELYLKGFELAVRSGHVHAVMTAYCPINGHWAGANYDLCTTLLRGEWGYDGAVMTDWWTLLNHVSLGGAPTDKDTASMIRAQNDLYMVVNNFGAEENVNRDNLPEELQLGSVTVGELQRSARNICGLLTHTYAFGRPVRPGLRLLTFQPLVEAPEPLPTVEASGGCRIDFSSGDRQYLHVVEETVFTVGFAYRCPGRGVTQSTLLIRMNGKSFLTLIVNGSDGQWVDQELTCVRLPAGIYLVEGRFPKIGMETNGLRLTPETP